MSDFDRFCFFLWYPAEPLRTGPAPRALAAALSAPLPAVSLFGRGVRTSVAPRYSAAARPWRTEDRLPGARG